MPRLYHQFKEIMMNMHGICYHKALLRLMNQQLDRNILVTLDVTKIHITLEMMVLK